MYINRKKSNVIYDDVMFYFKCRENLKQTLNATVVINFNVHKSSMCW